MQFCGRRIAPGLAGPGILLLFGAIFSGDATIRPLDDGAPDEPGGALASGGNDLHHTIPREIRAPRSGRPGWLPPHVANHPDVIGRPGLPNRWPIPREVHTKIHPKYNQRFKEELGRLRDGLTVDKVLQIRDTLVKDFDIEKYRP